MKIITRALTFTWKTIATVVAALISFVAANQVGWSGAELIVRWSDMKPPEQAFTLCLFAVSLALAFWSVFLIAKIAKIALWLVLPFLVYSAVVPGVWNGIASDFDTTRMQALKHHFADAHILDEMSERARLLSCNDGRIELTDDAKTLCSRHQGNEE